jgi:tripeptidyl-peptidase-1
MLGPILLRSSANMVAVFSLVLALAALASAKPTRSNHVLHESREHVPAGWVSTGAASASHKINMRIALPSKDFAGLEKALYEVSTPSSAKYGQHLNTEQASTA